MTDGHDQEPPGPGEGPEVGSVAEEAAKLFGALADIARDRGTGFGDGIGGLAGHAAAMAQEVNEHIATGSAECRYCPICRVVHAVRETSPEVRDHLLTAASSFLQAAAGMMETLPPRDEAAGGPPRGPEVERIDLDDSEGPGEPT